MNAVFSAVLLLALAATACSGPSPGMSVADVFVATSTNAAVAGGGLGARLDGHVVVADGCLVVRDAQGQDHLAVWPAGFSLQDTTSGRTLRSADGRFAVVLDGEVALGGGFVPPSGVVDLARPIPAGCLRDEVFMVNTVEP